MPNLTKRGTGEFWFFGPTPQMPQGYKWLWWILLQESGRETLHQFRVDEVKVAYLSDELPTPGAGDLPRRRQIKASSIFDKESFKDEKGEIAILDLQDAKGDVPPSDAWRLTSFRPGIEKIVKIPSSETK